MSMHFISTQTTTTTAQITFSSIPQTFTHLQIRVIGRHATSNTINASFIQLNGFGGTYPYYHTLNGDGASATSGAGVSSIIVLPALAGANATANVVGVNIIDILDYSSTTKNKVVRAIGGVDLNGSGSVAIHSGFSIDTTALTSITLGAGFASPYAFAAGTRVDLYGITSNPIATGA